MKPLRLLLLTVLVLLSTSSFASSPVKILVIHSYTQEYPWTRSQHDAFTATLVEDSDRDVLINTEYLDTKRRRYDAFYGEMFYAYLKDKYIDYIPDIIYTTDDNALTFALEYFNELFADTPIIFSGVNDYSVMDRLDETRVTGVFEKKEISPNLSFLQDINPGIKEILLIGDGSNTYQAIENEIRAELINYPDIQASFLSHHYIENLKAELVKKSEIYIFLTTLGGIVDKHEHVQSLEEIISAITDSGEHIILSMEDAYLYKGVLGGYVTSGKSQGATAARLALDILQNKPVAQIPVITKSPNEYIFDHNELARHALALPVALLEKATVLNQPPSFYERNRILILGSIVTLVSLLLVSMLVFLIILSRKNQKILAAASTTRDLAASLNEYSRQLENEKRKLNQAQTIAHIGNYTWEIADNVTTWSDELFRIVGKDRTTFTPSYEGYLACIHPEDRNNFVALTRNVTKNLGHYTGDYRILRSNGEVRHVHEEGEAVLNSNGNMVGLVGVIQDITDRTHAEAEQDRLQRELAQARKMEALGKLTGGIAHDFNNMLGIIIGYTELLKERYQSDCEPTMRSYLENIEQASNRARELVSKMMVFSRSDVRENKPLHLDIALRDTVEMLRSIIPSSIEINLNCEDQLPRVIMDSVQLQQIMMNLCLNAKDAMNGKGKLDIRLGWYRALNIECMSCHKHISGSWIRLSVSDTGVGMTNDVVERIFEPFFTTKGVGEGTGMGMSILHAIVDSLQGHILIDTKINSGTTFHLLFPPFPEQSSMELKETNNTHRHGLDGHGEHILIVDDEMTLAEYVASILEQHDYRCSVFSQSAEALKYFIEQPDEFDLIITDQTMPELTGVEMISQIRNIRPGFPAILVTGYSEIIDQRKSEELGINGFLEKPVSSAQLLNCVAETINRGTDKLQSIS